MRRFVLPILLAATLPAGGLRIVPGINAFTAESYRQLAGGDANLILSPFNIGTTLSMALGGARGATASEIAAVLHQHYDAGYDSALASLAADLTKAGNTGANELLMANGLWVQQGIAIQPAFQKTLADQYHAPLTPIDFTVHAEEARGAINRWTEQQTKNRIRDLLGPGSLDGDTRLVLTSAIYFYGKWEDPFLLSRTEPAPFTLESGGTTQASFMNQAARFAYAEMPSSQILEMRYAGTRIAFDVILPKTPNGLPDLEKSLTSENLSGWLGNLSSRRVRVSLPKFRAETEFSLGKALAAMGMRTAFTNSADFSGIDGHGKVKISAVVHKAFVDVSEQGTEAAAATGMAMRSLSVRMPEPAVVFRADHPFLFVIRDTGSEAILFIGRLINPKA